MSWFSPNVVTEPVVKKKMEAARIAMQGMPVQIHTGPAAVRIQLARLEARERRLEHQLRKKIAREAPLKHVRAIQDILAGVKLDADYLRAKLKRMT